MKYLLLTFLLVLMLPLQQLNASCTLVPVSLEQRVKECDLVAKAIVLEKKCAWDDEHKNIYTVYTVLASQTFTSEHFSFQIFDVAVIGGQVGNDILQVNPSFNITVPTEGMLFLKYSPISIDGKKVSFIPYGYAQGYVPYDIQKDQPQDIFFKYKSIETFEAEVVILAKDVKRGEKHLCLPIALPATYRQYQDSIKTLHSASLKKSGTEGTFAVFINSVTPTVVNGGIGSEVTVNGSGFGTRGNASSIALPNADNGGRSFLAVPNEDILWWTDSQIRFRVSDGYGTGRILITTSNGQTVSSLQTLTLNYSIINYTAFGSNGRAVLSADWYNRNGAGGYSFTFNQSFNANALAVQSFKRALESWRCNTLCNLNVNSNTTSTTCQADDGINLVSFNNNCGSWEGVLAVTFNRISTCTQNGITTAQVREFDMLFGPQWNWNYGPGATDFGQTDFETVALHEIGHTLQHGHVIDQTRVMHYSVSNGSDKRTLESQSAIAGTQWMLNRSNTRNNCGNTAHRSITSNQCRLNTNTGSTPTANFSADRTSGCSPLTVNFSDLSSGNPTLWQWDVDGNGTIDYTSRNVTHTYTVPGTYTVRFTVSNGFGSNQAVRVGYISISVSNISLTVSPSNATVCSGSSVTLSVSGADSYTWTNSAGQTVGSGSVYSFTPTQTTTLMVRGTRNGCTAIQNVTVSVYNAININTNVTHPTNNQSNGSLAVNASNGLSPYSYRLNNGFYQNGNTFSGLNAGAYTITVKDARGCLQTANAVLTSSNTGGGGGGNTGACTTPIAGLRTVNASSATVSWNTVGGATNYIIMYRIVGGGWSQTSTTQTSITLTGLTANANYEAYVRTVCSGGTQTAFSNAVTFKTSSSGGDNNGGGGNTGSCNTPASVNFQAGNNYVSLTWQPVIGAVNYRVSWRIQGANSWITATIFTPNLSIASLLPNSNYEIQLFANCGNTSSSPTSIFQVKTLNGREEGTDFVENEGVNIYPNPTTGILRIQGIESGTELILTDLAGKILLLQNMEGETLDLGNYPKGIYLLQLRTENQSSISIHKVVLN